MSIEILDYKEVQGKGALKGFANLFLSKSGLELFGCGIFEKDGKSWVSMPQKEYTDKEGQKKYLPQVKFRERNHQDAFSRAVIEAIHAYQPKPQTQEQGLFDQEMPF